MYGNLTRDSISRHSLPDPVYRQTTHVQSNLVSPQLNQSKTYWIPGCGFRFPLQWILDGPISFSTVDIGFLSLAGLRIPVSTGMISRIDSGTKICSHGATCTWFSLVMWWYRGLLKLDDISVSDGKGVIRNDQKSFRGRGGGGWGARCVKPFWPIHLGAFHWPYTWNKLLKSLVLAFTAS